MTRDLFLAILAMDSYNRGYGAGINGLDENGSIGAAHLREFLLGEQEGWEDSGFYAIAYEWNGETIISYRGTDNYNPFSSTAGGADFWAFGIGLGITVPRSIYPNYGIAVTP